MAPFAEVAGADEIEAGKFMTGVLDSEWGAARPGDELPGQQVAPEEVDRVVASVGSAVLDQPIRIRPSAWPGDD